MIFKHLLKIRDTKVTQRFLIDNNVWNKIVITNKSRYGRVKFIYKVVYKVKSRKIEIPRSETVYTVFKSVKSGSPLPMKLFSSILYLMRG